jgi:plastocyanin
VPAEAVTLDQNGCIYRPHVFGMIAGQQLNIKSSDETAHNIHALPKKNTEFNISQPKPSTMERKGKDTFTKPESPVKIKCDVHGWMSAWVHVMEHPFFDTTKDHYEFPGKDDPANKDKWGTFEIKNLPAGDYEIEAWHETYGKSTQKVSVKDGETKEITFEIKKK